MNKNKIIIIFAMLIFCAVGVSAIECGSSPVEGCKLSLNTTFLKTEFKLNDSNQDGAISINNSVIVSGNGSTFTGNNSISSSLFYIVSESNGTIIKDLIVRNYSFFANVGYFGNIRVEIYNISAYNFTSSNIGYFVYSNLIAVNISAHNNIINNFKNYAFLFNKGGNNNTIYNNTIINSSLLFDYGNNPPKNYNISNNIIVTDTNSGIIGIFNLSNSNIHNNYVNVTSNGTSGFSGFNLNYAQNSNIFDNFLTITDCSTGYAIDINDYHNITTKYNSNNNRVYNNYIYNYLRGIDIGQSNNNSIFNNNISTSLIGGGCGSHGIMFGTIATYSGAENNTGYNNIINNTQFGLLFEAGSKYNTFRNNYIYNSRICLYDLYNNRDNYANDNLLECSSSNVYTSVGIFILDNSTGTTYINNTIIGNCTYNIVINDRSSGIFIDNIFNYSKPIGLNNSNITINNKDFSLVNFTSVYNYRELKIRNLKIINNAFALNYTAYITNSTYNVLFIKNQSLPLTKNTQVVNYSSENQTLFIRENENEPYPSSIATTINDVTLSYINTINILNVSCYGTGNINLSNMLNKTTSGAYSIYHNGVYVGYSTSNNYTITSCSDWLFNLSYVEPVIPPTPTSSSDLLNIILGFIKVLWAVGCLVFVVKMATMTEINTANVISLIIAFIILLGVGLTILEILI